MSGLTWLHLSDWHHKDLPIDPEVVRDRLIEDIKKRVAISPDLEKIDFIIFSGDVATGGRAEEYKQAKKEFFDYILEAAGVSPRQLFIVPGNHDLDEAKIKKLPDEFQKDAASKEDADLWLNDAAKREQLLRPFRDFKSFVSGYTNQDSPDYSNVRTWEIEGKKVSLVGINSAWWCRRHKDAAGKPKDFGFLLVGEPQINKPLGAISHSDLRIAVLHHSQDWLEYSDGKRVWSRLRHECNFILHGHGHEPEVTAEHGTGGDCVIIPAGASFERRIAKFPSHINSYNFAHLDLQTGKGTVFLRRWIDERTEWAKDDQTSPDGKFSFNLPGCVPVPPGPSFSSSVPHQIRPPPEVFTGRKEVIDALFLGIEGGAVITGLQGMGGVGKTALAQVLAKKLAGRYPDGQIFVEMKGTDKKPLTVAEAMAQVIHAYDPEFKVQENEAELTGRYFSILYGKRTLILLDNVASRQQVEPLLPPDGSALLITSRNKFALAGLNEKDLDLLPLQDSKMLLWKITKRIGEDFGELARLCGCLPLALLNAAYALKEKPNITVGNYVDKLRDARKRLELVDASFELSYDLLTPELQNLWSLLSVFPADFDSAGAAAVWEMKKESAEDALSELMKLSLVNYTPAPSEDPSVKGRYHLHDLARTFAASRLDPSEKDKAQWLHAEHYLLVLSDADNLYRECGKHILEGLRLFDLEVMNILAVQDRALCVSKDVQADSKDLALRLLCSYPNAGAHIFAFRLHPEKHIKFLEDALYAADKLRNRKMVCLHLNKRKCSYLGDKGLAYAYLGKIDAAIRSHKKQLKIARKNMDKKEEGDAIYNIGRICADIGKIDMAIECYENATSVYKEAGDHRGEAKSLIAQGIIHRHLGDAHSAIGCHEKARNISREKGHERGVAYALNNLGNDHVDLDEINEALNCYDEALGIDRTVGNRQGEVADLGNMGSAYAAKGEYDKAINFCKIAIEIAQIIGDRKGLAKSESMLGIVCEKRRIYDEAIEHHKNALKIIQVVGYRRREGQAFCNLGNVYAAKGDHNEAIFHYQEAIKIARNIRDRKGEAKAGSMLGIVYAKQGDNSKAIEHFKRALKIVRQIGYLRREGYALENLGDVYNAKGNHNKALGYYEQALASCRENGDTHSYHKIREKIKKLKAKIKRLKAKIKRLKSKRDK